MDYEKKYKEAAKAVESLLFDAQIRHSKSVSVNALADIFLELKESEDERIRKSLIDMLKNDEKCYLKEIAWLEKQGEQKDILEGAVLDSNKDGLVADTIRHKKELVTCPICGTKIENQSGQKSAEWSEEDKMQLDAAIHLVSSTGHIETMNWLKALKDKVQPQLQQGWSEEDELNLSEALHHIRMYNLAYKADKLDKWLKSLKERVQSHLKHELSEKDYNEIETIACHLDNINNEGMAKVLRSIRDKYYSQSKWKPSEEQFKLLKHIIENVPLSNIDKSEVGNLYLDLKKLTYER